jgi:hypothetical protein
MDLETKIPLKIKIFLWQMCQDAMLTRENMKKRNWTGSPFCSQVETNGHLFFNCSTSKVVWGVLGKALGTDLVPGSFWQAMTWFHMHLPQCDKFHVVILSSICWAIWNVRNRVTFDKYNLKSSSVITFYSISLLIYWAGLQKVATDKEKLIEGPEAEAGGGCCVLSPGPGWW